jgi:hypothetical protein
MSIVIEHAERRQRIGGQAARRCGLVILRTGGEGGVQRQ